MAFLLLKSNFFEIVLISKRLYYSWLLQCISEVSQFRKYTLNPKSLRNTEIEYIFYTLHIKFHFLLTHTLKHILLPFFNENTKMANFNLRIESDFHSIGLTVELNRFCLCCRVKNIVIVLYQNNVYWNKTCDTIM